jgi:hypothetical protein
MNDSKVPTAGTCNMKVSGEVRPTLLRRFSEPLKTFGDTSIDST